MATLAQVNHVKTLVDTNATLDLTIVADDASLLAVLREPIITTSINTVAIKTKLLALFPAATYAQSHNYLNAIVIAPPTTTRVAYVSKRAEAVRLAVQNATASGVQQDFAQHALRDVTKFGTISVADIGAALTKIQSDANKFQTSLIIAGMTSGITAAVYNDDAPWASITYAEFGATEKRALRGLITNLKTDVDYITAFNRCGFILSGLVGEKNGSWLSKFGTITKANQSTWWPPMHRWSTSMPASVQAVTEKRINAQKEWCAAHPTEIAALILAVVL